MENTTRTAPLRALVTAGLAAGLVVNLVDVPSSAILVSPRWTAFLASHGVTLDVPAVSAFFTTLHFVYGVALAWLYDVFCARYGRGARTALLSTTFALGMTVGTLLAGLLAGRLVDRAAR